MNLRQKMSLFLLCSIFSVCNGEDVSKVSPSLDLTNMQVTLSSYRPSGEGEVKIETLRLDL